MAAGPAADEAPQPGLVSPSYQGQGQGQGLHGAQAAWLAVPMALAASFVMCGYELVRTTANTLFVTAYGKAALPAVMALIPVGVTVAIYGYGRLLSWLGPQRTLRLTTLLSGLSMILCYVAIRTGWRPARGILFVLKEAYVVLLVEQYWSYFDSMLSRDAAKRWNGPICGIASVGAILGGRLLALLSGRWGTLSMVLLAALTTLPAVLVSEYVYRRHGEPPNRARRTHHDHLGLHLFRRERMLVLLIAIIAASQVVATGLDLAFKGILQDQIPDPDRQNAYSGNFYSLINFVALVFQFLLAPLLLLFVPRYVIFLAIPVIHICACLYLYAGPSLYRAGLVLLLFKSIDYSLFRATKELLYVPLSFDVRYRAKEIIDVLGYRTSKGLASLAIMLLQNAGVVFGTGVYALLGVCGAGAWLGLVWPISRYDGNGKNGPPR